MNSAANSIVLAAPDAAIPLALAGLTVVRCIRERAAVRAAFVDIHASRIIVVPDAEFPDAFLAAVVARVMVDETLGRYDIAYVAPHATPGTKIYGLPHGIAAAKLAVAGTARQLPLIRDDTGVVLIGEARQLPESDLLHGETFVDSHCLWTGLSRGTIVEPVRHTPGVRAKEIRRLPGRWHSGRAVQTGGEGIALVRDGIRATAVTRRSTFYRNDADWNLVLP